jgi:hypothetical protein
VRRVRNHDHPRQVVGNRLNDLGGKTWRVERVELARHHQRRTPHGRQRRTQVQCLRGVLGPILGNVGTVDRGVPRYLCARVRPTLVEGFDPLSVLGGRLHFRVFHESAQGCGGFLTADVTSAVQDVLGGGIARCGADEDEPSEVTGIGGGVLLRNESAEGQAEQHGAFDVERCAEARDVGSPGCQVPVFGAAPVAAAMSAEIGHHDLSGLAKRFEPMTKCRAVDAGAAVKADQGRGAQRVGAPVSGLVLAEHLHEHVRCAD